MEGEKLVRKISQWLDCERRKGGAPHQLEQWKEQGGEENPRETVWAATEY